METKINELAKRIENDRETEMFKSKLYMAVKGISLNDLNERLGNDFHCSWESSMFFKVFWRG